MRAFVTVFVMAMACNPAVKASDPVPAPAVVPEIRSLEFESCARTEDCDSGLHCFDQECRRVRRSVLGDYQAELARRMKASGDREAAVAAYGEALSRYQADGIEVPIELDCEYGTALVWLRQVKERAELAARVLHRCLTAAPVGSRLRTTALADLTALDEVGLDPAHLTRTQLADLYLTRPARRPSPDKVAVAFAADPAPTARSFPLLMEAVKKAPLRPALVACWEVHEKATRRPALSVALPLKSKYRPSEYDDEPGTFSVVLDPAADALAAGAEADAQRCVRAALEAELSKIQGLRDPFSTKLVVSVE
jgi:hypothetical protein